MKRALLIATLLAACTVPEDDLGNQQPQPVSGKTIISLTFDDTLADQAQVAALTEARGMRAVFYVNSGRVGTSGYMSLQQLLAMQANGHEIGGHTISHQHLTQLSADDAKREICNDRASLLQGGFRITSFAYPFSDQNAAVQQIAADCGYNSARLVGGLVAPTSCNGCPYADPIPPPQPYAVRTNDSIGETTTLDDMKLDVTQAESHGGGWVPIVMHHVCDGCATNAVSPSQLAEFLDWLQARASIGTVVATVDQVMGGAVKPAVDGPVLVTATGTNMIQNPSLETDANGDQVPDCWQRGGSGTNSATFTLTNNAFDGSVAQRIDMTSFSSGARRLVTKQDTGTCAPAITPGHTYKVTAHYIANIQPIITIYYRSSNGTWTWLSQSSKFPASSSYALATYTTPAMPAGATQISVGLTIASVGSLTMDAFTLTDTAGSADTTAPSVSLTAPAAGSTVSGTVLVSATATDAGGVARVEFLANGSVIATDTSYPYWISWNSASFAGKNVTLAARAVDLSGNSATSTSRTVTVAGAADTTPPTVALTSPANGATVSGTVTLSADASDAGGIAKVEFYANGTTLIATELNAPYSLDWDTTPYAGTNVTLTARAYDKASNTTTSAARTVTVTAAADTTPPSVVVTSPAGGSVSGTVTLAADASDAGGIARVDFLVNGATVGSDTTSPYSIAWDSTAYAGQQVAISARAVDNAGNTATSASRQITVTAPGDTTLPTAVLTSPDDGATVSGTVTVAATANDDVGVTRVEFLANGTIIGTDTSSPYSMSWDTTSYGGTTVTLTARAFDAAGNSATSVAHTVTVTASTPTNLIKNASLETDADGDQVPDCWQRGGSGTNTSTFTLTSNAFDGTIAQRIDMTSFTSGARRLVTRQDSGTCAPVAIPGHRYTMTAHYIANTTVVFTVYYRNSSGTWVWLAQSAAQPVSSSYTLGTWTTPAIPSGATHISVSLSIIAAGSLTTDAYTLVDAGP